MKLYIKYMVSLRCKMLVKDELEKLGIQPNSVELGMVEVDGQLTQEDKEKLSNRLKRSGLEILNDEKNILVEKIIHVIDEMIHSPQGAPNVNDSEYISRKIGCGYNHLSQTFSEIKGMTIQQYIIKQKIEAVKEYLLYDELTLTEIAHKLNYSSVAHLSNQFKKVTGLTPTYYRLMKTRNL